MNPPEVFIVEDDLTARNILTATLALEGYKVASFYDGNALLAAIRKCRPSFIVLDCPKDRVWKFSETCANSVPPSRC